MLFSLLLVWAFGLRVWGQASSVDWYTLSGGGGGTSTGGVYAISGTIGQPDAGTMSGGNYTLTGGFWSVLGVLQTPGAPWLWATRTTTNTVCIWWPLCDPAWQLQATTNFVPGSTSWITCDYMTNGPNCAYVDPLYTGKKFYRLNKP